MQNFIATFLKSWEYETELEAQSVNFLFNYMEDNFKEISLYLKYFYLFFLIIVKNFYVLLRS